MHVEAIRVTAVVAGANAPRLAARLSELGVASSACSAERAPDEVWRLRPGVLLVERFRINTAVLCE